MQKYNGNIIEYISIFNFSIFYFKVCHFYHFYFTIQKLDKNLNSQVLSSSTIFSHNSNTLILVPKIKTFLSKSSRSRETWRKGKGKKFQRGGPESGDGSPIAPYLVVSTTVTGSNLIRQVTDTTAFGLTGVLYRLAYRFFRSSSHPRRISYLLLFQTF